jgi:hypothetical protein
MDNRSQEPQANATTAKDTTFDINGDGRTDTNEYRAALQTRAALGDMMPESIRAAIDQRVDQDLQTMVANSQKALAAAGMDLDGDGKVAMNEFRAALGVHNKTPIDAILADADGSKSFNPNEVAAIQERTQDNGKGGR